MAVFHFNVLSFLCIFTLSQHGQALNCANDNQPTCQSDSDCADASNLDGLNQACGDLTCVEGTCQFEAWQNAAPCAQTNYIYCRGNDALCIRGPTNLNHEATCTGYQNEECVYRWCPIITRPLDPVVETMSPSANSATTETVSPTTTIKFPEMTENTTSSTLPSTITPSDSPSDMPSSMPSNNNNNLSSPILPLAECSTPCTQTSDCEDANNLQGLNSTCGELTCVSGICQFDAWGDDGDCMSTNFVECFGNDTLCTKGPSELNFQATCTGWENNECVYQWCPGDAAATADVAAVVSSSASSTSPTVPEVECSIPCTQDSDCHDPMNTQGLEQSCGDLVCVLGACQFEAWNNSAPCAQTNYLYCRGKDDLCIKGPSELNYFGTCTGFQFDECIYRWCVGDLKTAITETPPDTTEEPLPTSTETPESTNQETDRLTGTVASESTNQESDGFTGRALSISFISMLSWTNLAVVSAVLSLTFSWC